MLVLSVLHINLIHLIVILGCWLVWAAVGFDAYRSYVFMMRNFLFFKILAY